MLDSSRREAYAPKVAQLSPSSSVDEAPTGSVVTGFASPGPNTGLPDAKRARGSGTPDASPRSGLTSILCRDVQEGVVRLALAASLVPRWEHDRLAGWRVIGDLLKEVTDDVQPRPLLVV